MTPLPFPSPLVQGSTYWSARALWQGGGGEWGLWEGKEGWTGMVRNPSPCSSNLEAGIIPPSEPSPHWLASRLAFSFRFGPCIAGIPPLVWQASFLGSFGSSLNCQLWWVGALALGNKWAEYITRNNATTQQCATRASVTRKKSKI